MLISLDNAKQHKLFYFVITGTIYNPQFKKCLILQRSKKEKAHPSLWGVVGGKLEWEDLQNNKPTRQNHDILDWDDLIEKLLKREALEESGLEVGELKYLDNVVFLRPDHIPVVCFKFAVKYLGGEVKIAPEFDDFAWVDRDEVKKYQCIEGIGQEVAKTINLFS
jgi:ADP-ribose pyrophosphatase YjhB (NUDIX family)